MAAVLAANATAPYDDYYDAFVAATSLQQQFLVVCEALNLAEQTFNGANPNATVNNITIDPTYNDNIVTITVTLPLKTAAASSGLAAGISATLPY